MRKSKAFLLVVEAAPSIKVRGRFRLVGMVWYEGFGDAKHKKCAALAGAHDNKTCEMFWSHFFVAHRLLLEGL